LANIINEETTNLINHEKNQIIIIRNFATIS